MTSNGTALTRSVSEEKASLARGVVIAVVVDVHDRPRGHDVRVDAVGKHHHDQFRSWSVSIVNRHIVTAFQVDVQYLQNINHVSSILKVVVNYVSSILKRW